MPTMKTITCRDHGGKFTVEARRGRPPVRCTEETPCNAQRVGNALTDAGEAMTKAVAPRDKAREVPAQRKPVNEVNSTLSVAEARRAKERLEPHGWTVRGKAWTEGKDELASITATRGEEMIYGVWRNGTLDEPMQYSLWDVEKPSANGKPKSNLPFDPDEISDAELARVLVGNRVKWFNKLAGKEEKAVAGKERITIEHGYNATGDEVPGERIIKFVDADGTGWRAFRLDALLSVG